MVLAIKLGGFPSWLPFYSPPGILAIRNTRSPKVADSFYYREIVTLPGWDAMSGGE